MANVSVTFYNCASDNAFVQKTKTLISTATCQITERCSVKDPVLLLDMNSSLINANYAYIPTFGRYYYLEPPEIVNGNQLEITGHCDVLASFWNDFKNSPCIAGRSSSDYDEYIDDPMVVIKDKYRTETRKLNGTFTPSAAGANHYVLTIGGME